MKSLNKEKGMDFLKRVTMITVAALIMAVNLDTSDDRKICINSCIIAGSSPFCDSSCKCYDFYIILFCKAGYAYRGFSHSGLMVQPAFAGYDNICIF